MYFEEIRATETGLEKEIEGERHHPAGTWAMNLEETELVSPPASRKQPQRTCKCVLSGPCRREKLFRDYTGCESQPLPGWPRECRP